jgi:predicted site-specific integrase-resolvase
MANIFTLGDVAEIFGVKVDTLRRWVRQGELDCSFHAGRYFVLESTLKALLDRKKGIRKLPTYRPKGFQGRGAN